MFLLHRKRMLLASGWCAARHAGRQAQRAAQQAAGHPPLRQPREAWQVPRLWAPFYLCIGGSEDARFAWRRIWGGRWMQAFCMSGLVSAPFLAPAGQCLAGRASICAATLCQSGRATQSPVLLQVLLGAARRGDPADRCDAAPLSRPGCAVAVSLSPASSGVPYRASLALLLP